MHAAEAEATSTTAATAAVPGGGTAVASKLGYVKAPQFVPHVRAVGDDQDEQTVEGHPGSLSEPHGGAASRAPKRWHDIHCGDDFDLHELHLSEK